jgi:hypothetical protein
MQLCLQLKQEAIDENCLPAFELPPALAGGKIYISLFGFSQKINPKLKPGKDFSFVG